MNKIIWLLHLISIAGLSACGASSPPVEQEAPAEQAQVLAIDTAALLAEATRYLEQAPVPITSAVSPRSAGGIHDFYSEGDYWWPDPDNPEGAYIRRDGQTNPDNFTAHREAMRNLSRWVAALTVAYQLTGEEKYADHALTHLRAFFLDPATLMNPNLLYAQAIKGRVTGRGIGIIDTIHLIEVVKAIQRLAALGYLPQQDQVQLQQWFDQYASWLNTHPYGLDEKNHGNNHSTWWAAQLAAFASLAQRGDLLEVARGQFRKLLASQMAADGSFPEELERTKPYNYSLFNLEGYAVLCELASTPSENLWTYQGPHGSIRKAWEYMLPYIKDKSTWPKPPDVQHFDELPIRSPGLLLAARAYHDAQMLSVWQSLDPTRASEEVDRNFPLRQELLWLAP
ncbi:MAG: hypothetical protein D6772_11435 [Bacteroidetes bacterium]|nr:MAG: hypothetical protein D6772_11435 [Bacteroidota bacterium]